MSAACSAENGEPRRTRPGYIGDVEHRLSPLIARSSTTRACRSDSYHVAIQTTPGIWTAVSRLARLGYMEQPPGATGQSGGDSAEDWWHGPRARDSLNSVYQEFWAWTKRAYQVAAEDGDAEAIGMLDAMHEDFAGRFRAAMAAMRKMPYRNLPRDLPEPELNLVMPDDVPSRLRPAAPTDAPS